MKFTKFLFVLALIGLLTVSCKESKKEDVQDESGVEMTEEGSSDVSSSSDADGTSAEASSSDGAAAAAATGAASGSAAGAESKSAAEGESKSAAEGVEGETKGVEEVAVTEGVMTEKMADTPVIYPGCVKNSVEETRACSKEKFIAYLKKDFNYDLAKEAGLDPGDHEIKTVVHIDETGKCSVLRVTSANYRFEGEMKRLIGALPQMTPATKSGTAVPVTFVLPLNFKVQ